MKISIIIIVICLIFSYASAQGCNNNVCNLGNYFNETNGYRCYDLGGGSALCTCPGSAYEINQPCRLCNRANPANNVCRNNNGKLIQCLESNDSGTSYACACIDTTTGDLALTTDADCDTTVPLTGSSTTYPSTSSACLNGGVFTGGICHCPSGYSGAICQDKSDYNLCEKVRCKNNGVCAIQNPNGPNQSVCLCRYGTWGDYCELKGTLGFCSASLCLNGGACRENIIGSTRFAYCQCAPGYSGPKCETKYFTCSTPGSFPDTDMHEQGKYFECKMISGSLRIERKSCPKGLRFNTISKLCTY
ncbi:unnamed protein product [Adineta steineri]|uniref:EGF-like domain-containing protein n=1 Tax=Adineta steineri TaxID=433720 RepID=A0A814QF78_9BILA|nr:unnamed protein product [Adineta steineri]CAF1420632.1 unnamed protein product [Adineta steineri]CAF1426193.1 unnamed protein product [Adineta steineri]